MSVSSGNQSRPRHSAAQIAEFFEVFDRVDGDVSAAARELGLNRVTCAGWVRKAGLRGQGRPGWKPHPRQREFFTLLKEGMPLGEAARSVGVDAGRARRWLTRSRAGARFCAGGPGTGYNEGVNPLSELPVTPGNGRCLSLTEREQIQDLRRAGESVRGIGRVLGRPASTISRELARNTAAGMGYLPHAAHRLAAGRRHRPKTAKLALSGRLREYVQAGLVLQWSPEQISKKLVSDFPDDQEMRVSPETIYQSLYFQARGGLKREVQAALRTGRARRVGHREPDRRRPRFIDEALMISARPAEVQDRAVPGHWEGDLITGAHNRSAIGTLVERSTRYVMLIHLPGDHSAETVRDGLVKAMSSLPRHLRGSLTWDQGVEMARHRSFSMATGMPVYFCDPASPWQRGSNENTNGLLRQYFPKGTDLSVHSPEDLELVAQKLNGRPRKTLDWDSPAERLRDLLLST